MDNLERDIERLADAAARAGHRLPLLMTGNDAWTLAALEHILDAIGESELLLIGNRPIAGLEPTERRRVLGGECDTLVFDLWTRPEVNTLAAAAGCLRRGGLCLLLAPPAAQWSDYFCTADGYPELFWQHFLRSLEELPELTALNQREGLCLPDFSLLGMASDSSLPTADQLQAMAKVRRVLHGHRRRPLVLKADRGRGKSALLGLCAGEFLLENQGDILITAPRREALASFFRHAREALSLPEKSELGYGESRLRFLAPDQLLQEKPDGRILLVDEAAAIPPALLEQMLSAYSRVVFATTVHGYEGSGRGFDIRFGAVLDETVPQWQRFDLQEPIRWHEGDPLEGLLNRALLLDAEAAFDPDIDANPLAFDELDKLVLFQREDLLREVFGLLVVAHYQTTPADLQQLLDAPSSRVFALRNAAGHVLAAALVLEEGGLDDEWLDPVQQGERRLQGHLLPQSLVYHMGLEDALKQRCARVSRIAVHEAYRRRGLGRELLKAIEQLALEEGLDYVGSSFSADAKVLPFWLGADYLPLRLGVRRDPCSGGHALLVAKPLSAEAAVMLDTAFTRFSRFFPLQLRETFQHLEWQVALLLLNALEIPQTRGEASTEVLRYVSGEIAYDHAYPAICEYLLQWPGRIADCELDSELAVVIAKVLQARSWQELSQRFSLQGRARVEHHLRKGLRLMLSTKNRRGQ